MVLKAKREKVTVSLVIDKALLSEIEALRKKLERVGPKITKATLIDILLETGLQRAKERSR